MAGDWIKMETDLPDKPEVHYIANALNIDPDAVVGKLHRVWAWFDKHTVDGNAAGVTFSLIDRLVFVNGFAEAMSLCGWLEQSGHVLTLPNFGRHNGKTAKTRALTAKRVALHKEKTNGNGNAASVNDALPREEKRRNTPISPQAFAFKQKVPLPKQFCLSGRVKKWAEENGHGNLEAHLTAFVLVCEKKGYQYKNWDSAFMDAIRKDWAGLGGGKVAADIATPVRSAISAGRRTTGDEAIDRACKAVGWERLMGMDNFNRTALLSEVKAKYAEVCRG